MPIAYAIGIFLDKNTDISHNIQKGVDITDYRKYVKNRAEKSNIVLDCIWAFVVGGAICCFGQWLRQLYSTLNVSEENVKTLVPVTLIFIAVLITGMGVFDRIAKHAGAGTLVPITGFANAVASPAIDNKSEGYVSGVGSKMFVVAGPVIVYGTATSVVCGAVEELIKWIF